MVVYETQQTGLLSGHFSRERLEALAPDDFRRGFADFQEPQLSRVLELVELIRPLADERGLAVSELVVAYVLAHPGISGAIVGASSPAQVDGWAGAGEIELDREVVRRLIEIAVGAGYPIAGNQGYTSVDSRVSGTD